MVKVNVYWIGKSGKSFIEEGLILYSKRLKHYCKFTIIELKDLKHKAKLDSHVLKQKEAELFLSRIPNKHMLILLDEKGQRFNSRKFAAHIENQLQHSGREISFLIGGAFGVDEKIRQRADLIFSLSDMTFSHQLIRLILFEQLYRAFTIIKGEKYHND